MIPLNRSPIRGPLTESEKQWRDQFFRKLQSLPADGVCQTDFLDPVQLKLAEGVLKELPRFTYAAYGGYSGAERVCLRIFPAARQDSLPDVACLLVEGSFAGDGPGHRDFLGSVMDLGLRRDQVGDIVILPEGKTAVMVVESKAAYICTRLTRVGSVPVICSVIDPADLSIAAEEGKEITGTVAGLRLDALLSLGFGLSRSRAAVLTRGGLVKVNWRPVNSPAYRLREGDLVSLQGRGRLELISLQGETRKGRQRVKMKKFN